MPPRVGTDRRAPLVPPVLVSPRTRPFRRVLSENDSPAREVDRDDLPGAAQSPSVLRSIRAKVPAPSLALRRSPLKVQRSQSDTTAMEAAQKGTGHRPAAPKPVGEVGPWTSLEAFLLFEWWPPGRTKPDFSAVPAAAPAVVRSAKTMLRDEDDEL